jgi:hypothetical protein
MVSRVCLPNINETINEDMIKENELFNNGNMDNKERNNSTVTARSLDFQQKKLLLRKWNNMEDKGNSKFVCLTTSRAMKAYGGVEVYRYAFLTSTLHGREWSSSSPAPLLPGKEPPVPIDRRRLGGPSAGLKASEKRGKKKTR